MNNILISILVLVIPFIKADNQNTNVDALMDGLHRDAHEANFNDYFAFYNKSNIDFANEFQRFNTVNGNWEKSKVENKGAYRIQGRMNQYYFFDGEDFIYAPHEIVKIKSALLDGRVIHEYDESLKEFKCFINTEPPGFYKKVLMAESGKVPIVKNNRIIYSNIEPEVGLMLMYKLYG